MKSSKRSVTVWKHVKTAASGRVVAFVTAFSLGIALPTILFERPDLLRSEDSANWASAVGSLAAAIVALGLGVYAAKQDGRRHADKAHGAALVFFNPVTELLALLELIVDNRDKLTNSSVMAENTRKRISEIPTLLPAEVLEFLSYLPSDTAKLVVLSSQRLNSVKARLALSIDHADLVKRLVEAETFLKPISLLLGNQLFAQLFGSEDTPPWRAA